MNPLVLYQLIRLFWRYKWPFVFGALPAVLIIWWMFSAAVASIIFAISFVAVLFLIVSRFVQNVRSGWSQRSRSNR